MPRETIIVDFDAKARFGPSEMRAVEKRLNQDFMAIDEALEAGKPCKSFDGEWITSGEIIEAISFAIASMDRDDIDPEKVRFEFKEDPDPKAQNREQRRAAVKKAQKKPAAKKAAAKTT